MLLKYVPGPHSDSQAPLRNLLDAVDSAPFGDPGQRLARPHFGSAKLSFGGLDTADRLAEQSDRLRLWRETRHLFGLCSMLYHALIESICVR
jgi:hypothetical protein